MPVLGGHEKGLKGVVPFEVHLDPQTVASPFELLPKFFNVGNHTGNIFAV